MKKRQDQPQDGVIDERELEIIKAVAQAWYSQSESYRPTNEFDARKRNFRGKPSRFKIEAMTKSSNNSIGSSASSSWDFGQSLWDSYEIVTVSKKLETGLVMDSPFSEMDIRPGRVPRKRKESKNSLRKLFIHTSSRRFDEAKIPRDNDHL